MRRLILAPLALAAALASPAYAQTAAEADAFVQRVEADLAKGGIDQNRIEWVNATYLTQDTDALSAKASAEWTAKRVGYALEAAKFERVSGLSQDTRRKLDKLRGGITLPAPTRAGASTELANASTKIQSIYGSGKGVRKGQPINGSDIEAAMGDSRDPAELQEMWTSWHDQVGAPMKANYAKVIALSNDGAKELGYADAGAMWRSQYDMPADEFAKLTDTLWGEVKPLYDALHCFTRAKLNAKYGDQVQPKSGPIRADLLGNMWAQEWGNIYDVVAPPGAGELGYDTTQLLTTKGYDPLKMVKTGEGFFSSLGFAALPASFYERSQITKPADREVQCHASAWNIDKVDDLRIKMCTKVNGDDFVTVHHELGHNYYQRAYNKQSYLFQDGANDGFHEAIGDMVALSITPDYLVKIGLLDAAAVPSADKDIGLLLRQAMDKVAFLPFGLLVDKYRWGIYSGATAPGQYQAAWDALRLQYQGIRPPVARDESKFDAGAKYHVPASVPYTRYFLARILQFQFYEAACRAAGWKGPLHRCNIYGNAEVGERLNAMLELGASKPWPDALQAFTGSRRMSGKAMIAYFAPLKGWLDRQNRNQSCGWQ